MLTGTPLDLTPFGVILDAISIGYWLLAAGGLWLALKGGTNWRSRIAGITLVLLLFGAVPGHEAWLHYKAVERYQESMARFNERCKSAGEKIKRTVDNVEGVVWMKWRPQSANLENQFAMDDPYGSDCGGESCIAQLLRVAEGAHLMPGAVEIKLHGYGVVESIEPSDGRRYRYTSVIKSVRQRTPEQREQATRNNRGIDPGPDIYDFALERQPIDSFTARYGITWDDISTQEDRQHWIAGGSIKVVDLQTDEVIAERIGYMVDRGQGSRAGFRSPWSYAKQSACPTYRGGRHGYPVTENTAFAFKVLQPTKGE